MIFVGIADLENDIDMVHGLDVENEDIRLIIVLFESLMDTVETGEVDNGPQLVPAYWLARHREWLREGFGSA